MNQQKMNTLAQGKRAANEEIYGPIPAPEDPMRVRFDQMHGASATSQSLSSGNGPSMNLFQVLNKYIRVDTFLRGITDILRRVNGSDDKQDDGDNNRGILRGNSSNEPPTNIVYEK